MAEESWYKKRINLLKEKSKPIGTGEEKEVYKHPLDPNKVIAVSKDPNDIREASIPLYMKELFYLTKIAHLLYPENIPDTNLATSQPPTLVRDHAKGKVADGLSGRMRKLLNDLRKIGIDSEEADYNFVVKKNSLKYVDNLYFLNLKDFELLERAIRDRLNEPEQRRAIIWLQQLRTLREQDKLIKN